MAIVLLVHFLPDGRCQVSSGGEVTSIAPGQSANTGQASNVRRNGDLRGGETPDVKTAAQSPLPAGGGFRCPIPYAQFGNSAVELRVVLPDGIDRSEYAFPRLDWHNGDSHWIGSASLPSAPAFVSLPGSHAAAPAEASFGWNFYGFFVFAAAFMAVYFGWARWMRARESKRPAIQ